MEDEERIDILVVDDTPQNLFVIEAVLRDLPDVNVVKASSGREALRYLLERDFALVLLDVAMPEMDGFETAALIRKREKCHHTPIVYLTATGLGEEHMTKGYAVGAIDYLLKPLPPEILRAKVAAFVDIHKKSRELEKSQALLQDLNRNLEERVEERTQELRESNTKLEEALVAIKQAQSKFVEQERLRALGQMASGIAHDFNNALSPILGFSELMLDQPEKLDNREKVIERLQMMNTAARDAANTVSRLREFYRPREEGDLFLPVHLDSVVAQGISLTQPKWKDQAQAQGARIVIETEMQKVPPVFGNEASLREVLTNLIFNAVDAMPQGGTITVRTSQDGDRVVFEVSDTGMGMSEGIRIRCLEPFFTTKGELGTGLGLSMVYGIISRHGGTLDIQSEAGKGTTFLMRLPVYGNQKVEAVQNVNFTTRPLHVLVVEDEPQVRQIVTEYLGHDGHTVETASNGREGLEKLGADAFDLIVTDRAMPEMTGDQLAIAAKRASSNSPIIMLTGFGDLMKSAGQLPEAIDAIVSKPPTLRALREAISKVTSEA